ncbi:MAG: lysophospholipid acyltransferase family protein [Acutalibacteraceae bacterium]
MGLKNTKCRRFAKIFIKAVTPILHILYRVKYYGKENLPSGGGFIMASNHIQLLDPFYIAMGSGKPLHFMAKSEVFKFPPIAAFFRALNAFPVKRGAFDTESMDFAAQVVKDGEVLGIFPEGGIFPPDKRLGKARPGIARIAHESRCDIVPVSIYKEDSAGFFSKMTVRFGEPIAYSVLELGENPSMNDYRNAAELVMQKIRELWGKGHDKD